MPQRRIELVARQVPQLDFRIVDVIDVDALKAQIFKRLVQLVTQIGWRHAMTAADEIGQCGYARSHKCIFDILPYIGRWSPVEGNKPTLGADYDFVALEPVDVGEFA